MDDPGKVIVALGALATVAYSINAVARGALALRRPPKAGEADSGSRMAQERLARLEQAVDAIAVEIERISEGQRFTTQLLSEQARRTSDPLQRQLSSNTPV
jgi:ActR/RegA family two-component response regulator